MEQERKLSEVFNEICINMNEQGDILFNKDDRDIIDFIEKLELLDELLIEDKKNYLDGGGIYRLTKKFKQDKDYILNFLLMCESLLDDRMPEIKPCNIEKLYELKSDNIVSILENNGEIIYCKCKKKMLLKSKYNNLDYKVGGVSTMNTTINNGVTFNNSDVTNAGIVSGANSTNNLEVNINKTDEVIELSIFKKILNFLKIIISFIITNVTTIVVSVVSSVLTVMILNKLGIN